MGYVYVLVIKVANQCIITVGALGELVFKKGIYAYVGSAQSNFHQRIKRHLGKEKKLFWHIDYLLKNKKVNVSKIFFKKACKTEECNLATSISKTGKSIPRFGSSDCKCISHLFYIEKTKFLENVLNELIEKHNAF
ncbi:GIY-YIG nuclease family protein [Candidatus Bathyarchaeota archaeon]|nr:GIY-YIG nuclease family protein [Candidatus Bathyarchaeota archaeon]